MGSSTTSTARKATNLEEAISFTEREREIEREGEGWGLKRCDSISLWLYKKKDKLCFGKCEYWKYIVMALSPTKFSNYFIWFHQTHLTCYLFILSKTVLLIFFFFFFFFFLKKKKFFIFCVCVCVDMNPHTHLSCMVLYQAKVTQKIIIIIKSISCGRGL